MLRAGADRAPPWTASGWAWRWRTSSSAKAGEGGSRCEAGGVMARDDRPREARGTRSLVG